MSKIHVGDLVRPTNRLKLCLDVIEVTSVSADGKRIGFPLEYSSDDPEIESGKRPNYPAEDFELIEKAS